MVTGSNGQLGSELKELAAQHKDLSFHFYSREDLSIDSEADLRAAFEQHRFTHLVNCAAYTAVDNAEKDRETAFRINGQAVGLMAGLCREYQCRFIQISTDYVFNGQATAPIPVTAPTEPVNTYGASKLLGEQLAFEQNSESVVIRTSWVYSSFGKNFVKTMLHLMSERESIGVVADQVGSPTYAADLAEAILQIITSDNWVPGIYHYSNGGVISWYEFAVLIKELSGAACTVNPITTDQFPTPAKRPAYSVMDTSLITESYAVQIKDWKQSLSACLQHLLY